VITGPEAARMGPDPKSDQSKIALVIGGSRGIGAHVAIGLAQIGFTVVLTYHRHQERAERVRSAIVEAGGTAYVLQADISDPVSCDGIVAGVTQLGFTLGCLVLSASGGLEANQDDGYAARINTEAPARILRHCLPIMAPGGTAIYLTSHEAHFFSEADVYPKYREVALTKKRGEIALLAHCNTASRAAVTINIVSADLVEDSTTAKLLEMSGRGLIKSRRDMVGHLPSSAEVATHVVERCVDPGPNGSVSYIWEPDLYYTQRTCTMDLEHSTKVLEAQ
jgi:NAD(P)-dependent dehydrogenase (short-subunit alcohol dehydrogenase family)